MATSLSPLRSKRAINSPTRRRWMQSGFNRTRVRCMVVPRWLYVTVADGSARTLNENLSYEFIDFRQERRVVRRQRELLHERLHRFLRAQLHQAAAQQRYLRELLL